MTPLAGFGSEVRLCQASSPAAGLCALTFGAVVPLVSLVVGDSTFKPSSTGLESSSSRSSRRGAIGGSGFVRAVTADTCGGRITSGPAKRPDSFPSCDSRQYGARVTSHSEFNREGKTVVLWREERARLEYALLDVATCRLGEIGEQPFSESAMQRRSLTPERALSIYTFNRAYWEGGSTTRPTGRVSRCVAQNRFNSLVIIFAMRSGFLARVILTSSTWKDFPRADGGITPEQQQRNSLPQRSDPDGARHG